MASLGDAGNGIDKIFANEIDATNVNATTGLRNPLIFFVALPH
jgi:hypothetical protein